MRQTKRKFWLPVIATMAMTSIVMVLGNVHLCLKHSPILEISLFVLVVTCCCVWTSRAGTSGKAWLRTGISLVIAIALQHAYLKWLHSDSFPEALLSRKAREFQSQVDDARARNTMKQATDAKD